MSEIISLDDFDAAIEEAVEKIDAGVPVGLPTDTVYVLAGDPTDPGLTDRLFSLRHRPRTLDLSVLVGSPEDVDDITAAVPEAAVVLMKRFWPGSLTLVLPRNADWPADLGADEMTVGVRMSDHEVVQAICEEAGPIVATPAGVQGDRVFTIADEVADEFGTWVPLVLDGGVCDGAPSTVVDATGEEPRLIREGPVEWQDVCEAVGIDPRMPDDDVDEAGDEAGEEE